MRINAYISYSVKLNLFELHCHFWSRKCRAPFSSIPIFVSRSRIWFKRDRSSTATGPDTVAEIDRTCDMSTYSFQIILARGTRLIDYHAGLGQAHHAQGQRRTIFLERSGCYHHHFDQRDQFRKKCIHCFSSQLCRPSHAHLYCYGGRRPRTCRSGRRCLACPCLAPTRRPGSGGGVPRHPARHLPQTWPVSPPLDSSTFIFLRAACTPASGCSG